MENQSSPDFPQIKGRANNGLAPPGRLGEDNLHGSCLGKVVMVRFYCSERLWSYQSEVYSRTWRRKDPHRPLKEPCSANGSTCREIRLLGFVSGFFEAVNWVRGSEREVGCLS